MSPSDLSTRDKALIGMLKAEGLSGFRPKPWGPYDAPATRLQKKKLYEVGIARTDLLELLSADQAGALLEWLADTHLEAQAIMASRAASRRRRRIAWSVGLALLCLVVIGQVRSWQRADAERAANEMQATLSVLRLAHAAETNASAANMGAFVADFERRLPVLEALPASDKSRVNDALAKVRALVPADSLLAREFPPPLK